MGTGKTTSPGWQKVPVLFRSDLITAAEKEHLDISGECNRALAARLGMTPPRPAKVPVHEVSRVIIAPDATPATPPASIERAPVINAEDPTVPGAVLREKKTRKAPAALQPREPVPAKASAALRKDTSPAHPMPKGTRKGKKGDAIHRFVTTRIVREAEEGPDAIIAKDELYQRFERWCRDQEYSAIPEHRVFSVALKNKYAFSERIVGGIPSWVSIRLK